MKKNIIISISILLLALSIFFVTKLLTTNRNSEEGELVIVHELGEASINKNPETILVFDYGILETLDYFDIAVSGIVKSSLPSNLKHYDNEDYSDIGSLFEPNYELIYSLKPDVIFISARQSSVYEELNEIAPTIYLGIDNLDYMSSFKNNMSVLNEIFDLGNALNNKLDEIDMMVDDLVEISSQSNEKGLIILVNQGISVFGKGSRFDIIHSTFGVKQADENIVESTHGQVVTFEYVLDKNPDIIFVIDRGLITEGISTAEDLMNNSLVDQTQAAINQNIHYLDAEVWYITAGGIVATQTMINEIKAAYLIE